MPHKTFKSSSLKDVNRLTADEGVIPAKYLPARCTPSHELVRCQVSAHRIYTLCPLEWIHPEAALWTMWLSIKRNQRHHPGFNWTSSGIKQLFHGVLDYIISQQISAYRYPLHGHIRVSLLVKQTIWGDNKKRKMTCNDFRPKTLPLPGNGNAPEP